MRKVIFLILFACLSIYVFAQSQTAVIREMSGEVEIKRSGSSNWVNAKQGDVIDRQTIISTGFRSSAVIAAGNSIITVRALTRMSLEELILTNETETVNINLNTGRIRVEVNPPAGGRTDFSVQTPEAVASVRGTEFEMDTVSLQVIQGNVSYAPLSAPVMRPMTVSAGQSTWVDTDTGSAVQPIAAAESSIALPALAGTAPSAAEESAATRIDTTFINGSVEFIITLQSN